MSRKFLLSFAPLLAVVAFAVMPAIAQAQPHWYSNGVLIAPGTKAKPKVVAVKTKGTLTLHALGNEITCKVKDKGSIWNPAGGGPGEDEITEFVNSECTSTVAICAAGEKLEVIALNLPWYSLLLAGPPIRDEIYAEVGGVKKGIEVAIECSKTVKDVFTGILTPKIGTSVAEFGEGSGELKDPEGHVGTVTGNDTLEGPAGDETITVKNP